MNGKKINILSVLNDKLMVSSGNYGGLNQLFIISLEGRHLSTINTSADNTAYLIDATWTPRGNILYTIENIFHVTLMSGTGEVISYSKMQNPHISVFLMMIQFTLLILDLQYINRQMKVAVGQSYSTRKSLIHHGFALK